MVILIGGNSHTGKTLLSQKLMGKYKIPYLSIDHLKMGIFRGWAECGFEPESKDEIITKKLWPIIKGIIMTNIENNQHIIIEGVYLPYSINDLETEYISKIIFCKICFSEKYIGRYLHNIIIEKESIIENRGYGFGYTIEEFIKDNEFTKKMCENNNIKYFEIKENYKNEINNVYKWIGKEYRKLKIKRFA
ncbi:MAG: adenylate kinase [Treponema sp.]|jgi:putative acetyltransferase|nr:adenylate kinase [Treponema sp.]